MKPLWQSCKVLGLKHLNNKTVLQVAMDASGEEILKYATKNGIEGEIKFDDGRLITAEQRKKLYATFKDISDYTGDVPEYVKELLKFMFCAETGQEHFSLSNCSLEVARELISYVIEFVIENDIPLTELAIDRTDDIGKYLYYTIKFQKCCICGLQGIVYTLDKDKNKMCLCNNHYDMAKLKGLKEFERLYKVYGINVRED